MFSCCPGNLVTSIARQKKVPMSKRGQRRQAPLALSLRTIRKDRGTPRPLLRISTASALLGLLLPLPIGVAHPRATAAPLRAPFAIVQSRTTTMGLGGADIAAAPLGSAGIGIRGLSPTAARGTHSGSTGALGACPTSPTRHLPRRQRGAVSRERCSRGVGISLGSRSLPHPRPAAASAASWRHLHAPRPWRASSATSRLHDARSMTPAVRVESASRPI